MAIDKIKIRERLKNLLTNKTDCSKNIYKSRPTPLWSPELPAICVSIPRETFTKTSESPVNVFNRKQTVNVIIVAVANEDIEDVLDTIQDQVEDILSNQPFLTNPDAGPGEDPDELKDGLEPELGETEIITEAKVPLGARTLTYGCSFEKEWPVPISSDDLDELNNANTRFDINNDDIEDIDNTVNVRSDI